MEHHTSTVISRRNTLFYCLLFSLSIINSLFIGCSKPTDASEPAFVKVQITQPKNGQIVKDSILRVLTTVERNCGCSAWVEFYVGDKHLYTDFVPAFSFDWDIRSISGEYVISARAVVEGKAEDRDSVRVVINP